MSSSKNKLVDKGFYLSEEGLALTGNGDLEKALNSDLKEISTAFFPSDVERRSRKIDSLDNPHRVVLQVKSIKNVASPKIDENRTGLPRLLRIALTDGFSVMHAVETYPNDSISTNTPPGTKIRLMDPTIKIASGLIILKKGSLKVLGGRVERLAESWENSRKFSSFKRETGGVSGPPPWVPFGKKMVIDSSLYQKASKSLDENKIGKEEKDQEPTEFDSQRKDAIEEASKSGNQKVFGGGKQEIKDGKRALTKREEIQQKRKGRRGNKENEGESAKPPPSSGLCLSEFIPQKMPSVEEDMEDIPPQLLAEFEAKATIHEPSKGGGRREKGPSSKSYYPSVHNSNSNKYNQNHQSHLNNGVNDSHTHRNGRRNENNAEKKDRRDRPQNQSYHQGPPTGRQMEPKKQQHQQPRHSQKFENSDQDFGEWKNSTYTETQNQRKPGSESRTFTNRRNTNGRSHNNNNNNTPKTTQWKVNDVACARYWEDNKYYPVTIKDITPTTALVQFEGYGNFEEVLFQDLKPWDANKKNKSQPRNQHR